MSLILKAAADAAELLIYDDIGASWWGDGMTAKQFDADLKALGNAKNITVRINSGGGDVFDGLAIFNALKRHPANKTVCVDGVAASAASFIAMAGDTIKMGAGTFMMIHNARGGAYGQAEDMRRAATLLDSINAQMCDIYVSRTGCDAAAVKKMMDEETWMDPSQAIQNCFADGMSEDTVKTTASLDYSKFRNTPRALVARGVPQNTPARDERAARLAAYAR